MAKTKNNKVAKKTVRTISTTKSRSGLLIGGCILLCGGLGVLLDQAGAGFLIGIGIGLLAAYFSQQ